MAATRRLNRFAQHLVPSVTSDEDTVFYELEEANKMDGLRVSMIPGIPGIFAECIKNFMDARGVEYKRINHPMMGQGDNQELLYKLTAQKSLPTMLYNDERPRNSWIEQVKLADNLGTKGGSLIPEDIDDRILMFGLMAEILAEDGIVWNKRIFGGQNTFTTKYGWSKDGSAAAPGKVVKQLKRIVQQLEKQKAAGSKFMVGASLSAVDIYWATCTYMLMPPSAEILPRTKQNRGLLKGFAMNPPQVQAALDGAPLLVEHRDFILKTYCVTPAIQGGTL
jgi:glutathione S-transferase